MKNTKKKKANNITKEREYELIVLAKQGDRKAKQELIEAHSPFIATIVKQFTLPSWVSMEDVMQEGKIGLLDAIERFRLDSGFRLCTFAFWRIKKAIVAYLGEMGYMMKVPFPDVVKIKKIQNRLDMGLSPDLEADNKAINLQKNIHILHLILGCLPINPTEYGLGKDEDLTWTHVESQLVSADISDGIVGSIIMEDVVNMIANLTVIEGYMLGLYLGIYVAEVPVPLKYIAGEEGKIVMKDGVIEVMGGWNGFGLQIGQTYNKCSQIIKQSEQKFKKILRDYFDSQYDDYLGVIK